jgi:hypothetical protein
VRELKLLRTGDGRWRRFPFYYTVLALHEMNVKPALDELRYAAPVLERSLKRASGDKYAARRRTLAERVLAKC